jgi:hypothetical protein
MSYFSEIYGDLELSARAKLVLVYLHDRANKDGESWYAIGTMAKDLVATGNDIERDFGIPIVYNKAGPDRTCSSGPSRKASEVSGKWWVHI